MDYFFAILFISLLVVLVVVMLAFFPIKISWFFASSKGKPKKPIKKEPKTPAYKPARINGFKYIDDDDYDDPEI